MSNAPDSSTRALANAAALGLGVLGWLAAQWLTFGILDHAHVFTGDVAGHHHAYAVPVAVVAVVVTTAALALLAARTRLSTTPPSGEGTLSGAPGAGLHALGSVALFAAVEITEFAVASHHHIAPLLAVLVVGTIFQTGTALLARSAWWLVLRAISQGGLPAQPTLHVAVAEHPAPGSPGAAPSWWTGRLVTNRGPPGLPA